VLLKVPELAAEVSVGDVEMETEDFANPADASHAHNDVVSISDDDDDYDENDIGTESVQSTDNVDSDVLLSNENLNDNDNDDRQSSVDIYESSASSPDPADVTLEAAAVAVSAASTAAAAILLEDPSPLVPVETSSENAPASVTGNPVAELALPAANLDDSMSCFKTTKRKKPVLPSPPVSKDDDADDAEVIQFCSCLDSCLKLFHE